MTEGWSLEGAKKRTGGSVGKETRGGDAADKEEQEERKTEDGK